MSSIDDGPKIRKVLWGRLQSTFDKWALSKEERVTILGVPEKTFESWEIAGWISPEGFGWNRAVKLVEVHYALVSHFGLEDKEEIQRWLRTPSHQKVFSKIFEGKTPLEMMIAEKPGSWLLLETAAKYLRLIKE